MKKMITLTPLAVVPVLVGVLDMAVVVVAAAVDIGAAEVEDGERW